MHGTMNVKLFSSQYGATTKKTWIFSITAVRPSNLSLLFLGTPMTCIQSVRWLEYVLSMTSCSICWHLVNI